MSNDLLIKQENGSGNIPMIKFSVEYVFLGYYVFASGHVIFLVQDFSTKYRQQNSLVVSSTRQQNWKWYD